MGFATTPTSHSATPTFAIGQPDFVSYEYNQSNTGTALPNTLRSTFAFSIFVLPNQLLVSDRGNSRVLFFNPPYGTDMNASMALGQPDLSTANAPNPPTASSFNNQGTVWTNGVQILVADGTNNRVLGWNTFPTTSGQPADFVLGQLDMISNQANQGTTLNAATLNGPFGVGSDGTRIFVADTGNNRVLVYDRFPKTNGVAADVVIGRTSMTDPGPGLSQSLINHPTNLWWDGTNLLVADQSNNRIVFFGQ